MNHAAQHPSDHTLRVQSLQSVQVGLPQTFGSPGADHAFDREWTTGFVKTAVHGPVHVGTTNLVGDGQADRVHHGGPDKAVLAYAAAHYPMWQAELATYLREVAAGPLGAGAFGENLTIDGMTEADVAIGDVHRIGSVVLQVAQPRSPCWKIARRWRIHDLAARVQQSGRTGWYYRVLEEGLLEAGQSVIVESCPHPEWTVARVFALRYARAADPADLAALMACPSLAQALRATLERQLRQGGARSDQARLIGPN